MTAFCLRENGKHAERCFGIMCGMGKKMCNALRHMDMYGMGK